MYDHLNLLKFFYLVQNLQIKCSGIHCGTLFSNPASLMLKYMVLMHITTQESGSYLREGRFSRSLLAFPCVVVMLSTCLHREKNVQCFEAACPHA